MRDHDRHSAVSWAINGGSRAIRLINTWPDPSVLAATRDNVPSSISYVDGKPQKWGYTVGLADESFRWIKVLLEENHKFVMMVEPVMNSNTLLRKIHKTAQEVVADYLKLLWDYTVNDIRKLHPDHKNMYALCAVLTVPAIWSPAAKDKIIQAAKIAGMPANIKLVTEPEAAAFGILKDKVRENQLKVRPVSVRILNLMVNKMQVGDAFVVCDAGSVTVVRDSRFFYFVL